MNWLLGLALLPPLLGAPLLSLCGSRRRYLPVFMPWAVLPALALALFATPGITLELPWLLTGLRLGLDATGRSFLLFTALLWLIAGGYARGYLATDAHAPRFAGFFLATCTGNIGLILAQDVVGFYLFYALMSFAAYGLIVHTGTAAARRAGLVYIVMTIIGEMLLLIGFLLLVNLSGSVTIAAAVATLASAPGRETVIALLLAGFGIKAGALLLHMWLPLAHPVAPTPASAVLSGAMIKAGLLGWLRFLPLGMTASDTGLLVIFAGLAAAFYGVVIGLMQRDPKVILAYSSISQMGLMTFGVGLGLHAPNIWPLMLPAVTLYALQHALTKGALFLGVGVIRDAAGVRRDVVVGLGLLALALAGAPFTGGALAKQLLKGAALGTPWGEMLAPLLVIAAVATTLLMARLLWCLTHATEAPAHDPPYHTRGFWWLASATAISLTGWLPPVGIDTLDIAMVTQPVASLWAAAWPIFAGVITAYAVGRAAIHRRWMPLSVPAGDVLWPLIRLARRVMSKKFAIGTARFPLSITPEHRHAPRPAVSDAKPGGQRMELRMGNSSVGGALVLLCLLLIMMLLALDD